MSTNLPLELVAVEQEDLYQCENCSRITANLVQNICSSPNCSNSSFVSLETEVDDYYKWKAAERNPLKLSVFELTGQTKPLEKQRERQRLFKKAFLPNETRSIVG